LIVPPSKQVKTKVTERNRQERTDATTQNREVRVGSARLKIHFIPSGSHELDTVSCWIDGKHKRQIFPMLNTAIAEAKAPGRPLAKGDFGASLAATSCKARLQLGHLSGICVEIETV
jgi:hypothetical protein